MKRRKLSIGSLDLPAGYYAERGEAGVYLMDPDRRRVMRLPDEADFEELRGSGGEKELWRSLLKRLSQKNVECERLRARVEELGKQLEAAEAERDQANAIAEDLYEFFRNRVRESVNRTQRSRRRSVH